MALILETIHKQSHSMRNKCCTPKCCLLTKSHMAVESFSPSTIVVVAIPDDPIAKH